MAFEKPTMAQLAHRFEHHAPTGDQGERYGCVRAAIRNAAAICVGITPASEEQNDALKHLDSAMMFFNASIARNE